MTRPYADGPFPAPTAATAADFDRVFPASAPAPVTEVAPPETIAAKLAAGGGREFAAIIPAYVWAAEGASRFTNHRGDLFCRNPNHEPFSHFGRTLVDLVDFTVDHWECRA